MRAGSWVHAAAAPPHQAFTSDPAGVVSDAVRFCPFATGNDILYAKACTSRRAMPSHDPATLVWHPDGCAVTGFDARAFASLLQGRTLVFSGDARSLHAANAAGLPRPTQAAQQQGARCEDTGAVGQVIADRHVTRSRCDLKLIRCENAAAVTLTLAARSAARSR